MRRSFRNPLFGTVQFRTGQFDNQCSGIANEKQELSIETDVASTLSCHKTEANAAQRRGDIVHKRQMSIIVHKYKSKAKLHKPPRHLHLCFHVRTEPLVLRVGAEEGEAFDLRVGGKFGQELEDVGVLGARLEVEREEELEVHARDRARLELGEVDVDGGELREDAARTGSTR